MSRIQAYHPPQGTNHKWHAKTLNHAPWLCLFWDYWPATITATVDHDDDGTFLCSVSVVDFDGNRKITTGKHEGALQACLATEKFCQKEKDRIWLPWMETAIAAGWRPPIIK